MLARLECNNNLAPVHEYARHQSKLSIKKKKKKAKVDKDMELLGELQNEAKD